MTDDVADTLGTQETPALEFKESAKDKGAILAAICALANDLPCLGSGDLLIGVDKNGNPVSGTDTSDRTLLALTDMRDNGKILDRPSMVVTKAAYRGTAIVRIHVTASATPPVRLDGVTWVRPGPTTRRATREDERVLTERRRALDLPFDVRPVGGTNIEDIDVQLFRSQILPALVAPDVIEENERDLDAQLSSLRLADSTGTPTTTGLLLAGLNPTAAIPGAYIQFVRYDGEDVSAPVLDSQELRGNLIESAERLLNVLRGHLHTRIQPLDDFRDVNRPEYPIEALRETCLNAIIHRNYETSYAPVRIAWFRDRVEITNPGGPFGQVRRDNFDRVNDYRNPSLASAMKALGFVNRFGRGIGLIQASLRNNDNPAAEFVVDDSSWLVVLRCGK